MTFPTELFKRLIDIIDEMLDKDFKFTKEQPIPLLEDIVVTVEYLEMSLFFRDEKARETIKGILREAEYTESTREFLKYIKIELKQKGYFTCGETIKTYLDMPYGDDDIFLEDLIYGGVVVHYEYLCKELKGCESITECHAKLLNLKNSDLW